MNEESSDSNAIDTELRVRLMNLVMGEASDFERDQLQLLMEQRGEVAAYYQHLEHLHGLLCEVGAGELSIDEGPSDTEGNWQLSADRRAHVLAVLDDQNPVQSDQVTLATKSQPNRWRWVNVKVNAKVAALALTACVLIGLMLPALWLNRKLVARSNSKLAEDADRISFNDLIRSSPASTESFEAMTLDKLAIRGAPNVRYSEPIVSTGKGVQWSDQATPKSVAATESTAHGLFDAEHSTGSIETSGIVRDGAVIAGLVPADPKLMRQGEGAVGNAGRIDGVAAKPETADRAAISFAGQALPDAYYLQDDVQYFPAGTENKELANEFRAPLGWTAEINAPTVSTPAIEQTYSVNDPNADGTEVRTVVAPSDPAETTATVPDGGKILLGGILKTNESHNGNGVDIAMLNSTDAGIGVTPDEEVSLFSRLPKAASAEPQGGNSEKGMASGVEGGKSQHGDYDGDYDFELQKNLIRESVNPDSWMAPSDSSRKSGRLSDEEGFSRRSSLKDPEQIAGAPQGWEYKSGQNSQPGESQPVGGSAKPEARDMSRQFSENTSGEKSGGTTPEFAFRTPGLSKSEDKETKSLHGQDGKPAIASTESSPEGKGATELDVSGYSDAPQESSETKSIPGISKSEDPNNRDKSIQSLRSSNELAPEAPVEQVTGPEKGDKEGRSWKRSDGEAAESGAEQIQEGSGREFLKDYRATAAPSPELALGNRRYQNKDAIDASGESSAREADERKWDQKSEDQASSLLSMEENGNAITSRRARGRDSGVVAEGSSGKLKSEEVRRAKKSAQVQALDEQTASIDAFSTFSLHVSDVSFKLAQTALSQGQWPDATKIRIEEFVNALDYHDPLPIGNQKVVCRVEQAIHPFLMQRNLLRVSMRTAATGRSQNTPLRLTLLLDNSGSMERPDRRQAVLRAFQTLTQQLKPTDQITLISFASTPRLLADKVAGNQGETLLQLIENLPSEGGTNIELALLLAREKAAEQQLAGAQNRIVLLTDGAVNLGNANPDSLAKLVTQIRDSGIAFDAAGISAQDLNDEVLEALTRQGDGRYYLLDSAEAIGEGFAAQIAGALRPSAQNVKVQVEFNPQRVGRYKLLGFEKHRLNKEDFRNDKVDAAEMAAAEAGVAVYQYEIKPNGSGDVGSVSVRFRDLSTGQMVENRWPIPYESNTPRLDQAEPSMQLAASAALFAAKLSGGPLADSVDLAELQKLLSKLSEQCASQPRVQQLRNMIEQAKAIGQ